MRTDRLTAEQTDISKLVVAFRNFADTDTDSMVRSKTYGRKLTELCLQVLFYPCGTPIKISLSIHM